MRRRQFRKRRPAIAICAVVAGMASSASFAQERVDLTYDSLGRLTSVCHFEARKYDAFQYDSAGNRTNVSETANSCGTPAFAIIDAVAVVEGTALTFTVARSGDTNQTNAVNYATANGTATSGSDYTAVSGTLTFTAGQTSKTVTVATINNAVYESNETVLVNLSAATNGATIADSQGSGTIIDYASFAIANATAVAEGTALTFTVTRSGDTSQTNAVNYATANGTATSGSDYTAASGTLTFTAGQTSKTVTVATINDAVYESNETVLVNLSAATNGAFVADNQGSGTINNNDSAPSFAISDATATAGAALTFTVTKTGSTALTHAVNYATANGTAISGSQYTTASGTLSFTSSETSKTISVATTAGGVTSGTKAMYVNFSSQTNGATIADSQGVGTIASPSNHSPVAVNDSVNGSFNRFTSVTVNVLANDSDADGDPLTVTAASCIAGGCSVSIGGGGTNIVVVGQSPGTAVASYTISDGKGGTASAQATVANFY